MRPVSLQLFAAGGCALLCGCYDTSNLAPAAPDASAPFPSSEGATATSAPAALAPAKFSIPPNTAVELPPAAEIDGNRVYGLVELIDIAQRRNPATRVAWEEARQAAIKVGMAQAAYLPVLTASALAGYERLAFPLPTNLVPAGFATSNNWEVAPAATVKYLLFDFGGRAATVEEASQLSIAANAEFTTAHQKLIYNVAGAYFMLDGANATVGAAQQGLADARVLQESAEALDRRGLGTIVEVDLARRATAQAQFNLSQTYTAQKSAMSSLLEAMDLPPTTKLRVASVSGRPLPPLTAHTIDDVLREALRRRPDLLADVAKLRASDANIAAARSELLPKVSVGVTASVPYWANNVDNSPYFAVRQPQGAALLNLEWPFYDGGLLQNKLKLAESQRAAAADDLQGRTDQALREVALAYDQVETGLRQYNAALALQTASAAAFHSASDSYTTGVGTLTDAATAQTGLASARAAVARAHAQLLINGAALAFAAGSLTSSADFSRAAPR
ncbi:MAG TPA: TolC family protein [Roseiarcus sp.]|nr:TolC family protein [Roseiarcus sp.]